MFWNKITSAPTTMSADRTNGLADNAALHAEHAIEAARQVANGACDGLSEGVQTLRHDATPVFNRVADKASAIGHRSWDAVQEGSQRLRSQARQARDSTVSHVREEPVKSVLVAVAAGAALMAVIGWLTRSRRDH